MSYPDYLNRIVAAYLLKNDSHVSFWHEKPQVNLRAFAAPEGKAGEYYMTFYDKANYRSHLDANGIPQLDYKGKIGLQYNPIAIAQYGLGNFNLYEKENKKEYLNKAIVAADWLKDNLEKNKFGVYVWNHKFDWEYYHILKSPWYSSLAQGQGISLLIRIYQETGKLHYMKAASSAFDSLSIETGKGGVLYIDKNGHWWLEEYLVNPPTHILNGFIWTLWGVHDYFLVSSDERAKKLWNECIKTLQDRLNDFDAGYWSLYDLSGTRTKNLASPFYHNLHIVQLEVLLKLTGVNIFKKYSDRWKMFSGNGFNVAHAYLKKAMFKLRYF